MEFSVFLSLLLTGIADTQNGTVSPNWRYKEETMG
jgi:hypothetical protein